MSDVISVSAKRLGLTYMDNFCPRCFWLLQKLKGSPAYAIFPSIFSKIDSYTKHAFHDHFDTFGEAPPCLKGLGTITQYVEPPTHQIFRYETKCGLILNGSPDAMFRMKDGTITIADYKTAVFPTGADKDPLHVQYAVQLNVYGYLAERLGYGTVSNLSLIYTTPCTTKEEAHARACCSKEGFKMDFKVQLQKVSLLMEFIEAGAEAAKKLLDHDDPPESREGCKECRQVKRMLDLLDGCESPTLAISSLYDSLDFLLNPRLDYCEY